MTEYDYSPEGAARYQQKMDGICRWTYDTGRYKPADPFSPTTPAIQARPLYDYRERDYRTGESGSGQRKNRSRSVGERESRPSHSRSRSYAPASSQPPVIPGPIPQLHGQSTYSFDSSHHGQRSKPKRSTTMPLPPPIPPVPSRTQPVRSQTSHPSQGYNVYYPPQMPRPGESIMIPQGGVYLPPGTRPQFIQSPIHSPGYSTPQSPRRPETKSWFSKIGSFLRSRSPSPPSVVYVQRSYESAPQPPKRSKSSKPKGKRRHSERSGRHSRSERRYSY